ncbi:hypothetical protein P7D22_10990 [Lichenihabitans sp. Uapishka_5]|uniref:hypothetical protein n=1 Tax=Lichenihabitans sp. Uapishka_5 TaxID=3037302 RepID=UPI0029E8048D|nr:hypothetical protein [Lichenihabitans sp. Uapishka_5]MDX7951693.1 hypothetical protein [Lichenihabitans sp. Uapishka_5]
MSTDRPDRHAGKPIATDTKQTAPRRLALWIVPLALVALAVLLLGVHFTGGIK